MKQSISNRLPMISEKQKHEAEKKFRKKTILIRRAATGRSGFTLVEIMVVLGIIAVLSGSVIYMLVGNLDFGKEVTARGDINAIRTQLQAYEALNGIPPSTSQGLKALVERPGSEPVPRRWRQFMQKVPVDPWGTPYQYRYPGVKNPKSYDIYSLGMDRVESGDDVGNWE